MTATISVGSNPRGVAATPESSEGGNGGGLQLCWAAGMLCAKPYQISQFLEMVGEYGLTEPRG